MTEFIDAEFILVSRCPHDLPCVACGKKLTDTREKRYVIAYFGVTEGGGYAGVQPRHYHQSCWIARFKKGELP